MSGIYLYADEASCEVLSNGLQKLTLVGADTGHASFGDVPQDISSIIIAN